MSTTETLGPDEEEDGAEAPDDEEDEAANEKMRRDHFDKQRRLQEHKTA